MSIQYMHEQTDSSAKHQARCLNCPHKTDSFAKHLRSCANKNIIMIFYDPSCNDPRIKGMHLKPKQIVCKSYVLP